MASAVGDKVVDRAVDRDLGILSHRIETLVKVVTRGRVKDT